MIVIRRSDNTRPILRQLLPAAGILLSLALICSVLRACGHGPETERPVPTAAVRTDPLSKADPSGVPESGTPSVTAGPDREQTGEMTETQAPDTAERFGTDQPADGPETIRASRADIAETEAKTKAPASVGASLPGTVPVPTAPPQTSPLPAAAPPEAETAPPQTSPLPVTAPSEAETPPPQTSPLPVTAPSEAETAPPQTGTVHEHVWVPVTSLTRIEAETQTIFHEAEYETVWVTDREAWEESVEVFPAWEEEITEIHTVCNECGFDFTACRESGISPAEHSRDHVLAGGFGGWHTEAVVTELIRHEAEYRTVYHSAEGHEERRLIREARTETVVLTPAREEETVIGFRCPECGAVR